MSGHYVVCIRSDDAFAFSQAEKDAMKEGLENTWDEFGWVNRPISLSVEVRFATYPHTVCGGHDIQVYNDHLLAGSSLFAEADLTPNGRGAGIRVNPDTLGVYGAQTWTNMIAHEFGHLMDFQDVHTASCANATVMIGTPQPTSMSFIHLGCSDLIALQIRYPESPGITFDADYPSGGGGSQACYDNYTVTDYYYWTGAAWSYSYTDYRYNYSWCEPVEG